MKVSVNAELCSGCSLCEGDFPALFELNDDGKAVAINEVVPAGMEDDAREAAENCPDEAILVE